MAQQQASVVISAKDEATAVLNRINGQFENFGDSVKRTLVGLTAGLSAGYLAKQFVETADAMTLVNARLKLVTGSTEEFNEARSEAYRIAQANNLGLQETATLYTRLADPIQRLGGTTKEVGGIVDAFATSLRVGGASTQEASAATLQFAQAMASGKLSGDEFRSIAEASPRFMRALADGMGVPIEQLKKMSTEGKLTADVVGNALLKELGNLKTEAAGLPDTVSGAFQRLKNDVMVSVDALNQSTGATQTLASTLGGVAGLVTEFVNILRAMSASAGEGGAKIDYATGAITVLGKVFETVVLVGSDLWFILESLGSSIGGMAAIAVAAANRDWQGVKSIWNSMGEEAKKRRADLDAFQKSVAGMTDRVLAAREAAKSQTATMAAQGKAAEGTAGNFKKLESSLKGAADKQKDAEKAAKEYEKAAKAVLDLTSKSLGVNADYVEKLKALELWYSKNRDKTDQYVQAVTQLINQQPMVIEGTKRQTEELKRTEDQLKKATEAYNKAHDSAAELVQKYEEELVTMQMTGAERELQVALLALEKTGVDKTTQAYAEYEARITAAVGAIEAQKASKVAAETSAKEWERAASSIEQALTDALVQGFGNGKSIVKSIGDWIVNYFKTTIAKGIAQAITGAIMGGISSIAQAIGLGGGSGAAAGAGGINLQTLTSLFSGTALSNFWGGLTGTATGVFGEAGISGTLSAAYEALMSGNLSGAVGSASPYIAAAYGLYRLISGVGTGRARNPAQQDYEVIGGDFIRNSNIYPTPNTTGPGGAVSSEVLRGVINATKDITTKLGGNYNAATNYGFMVSASPDGLGAQVVGDVYDDNGQVIYRGNVNGSNENVEANIARMMPGMILAGLQESDFGEEINAIFDALNANTVTDQQLADAIDKANEIKTARAEAVDDATIDTADATQENTIILRDNSEVLGVMRDILRELLQASRDGFNDAAGAARDSGAAVVGAVLALADRPINVTVEVPEVNGGA